MTRPVAAIRWPAFALCVALALASVEPARAAAVADPLPAQKTAVLFGQKIRYYEMGRGPTVVLVHGLGSSARGDCDCAVRRVDEFSVPHREPDAPTYLRVTQFQHFGRCARTAAARSVSVAR